jgi:hypothetical protein
MHSGLVTCPWCNWRAEVNAPTRAEVVKLGTLAATRHTAKAGHPVKRGAKPRTGYYRGRPIE